MKDKILLVEDEELLGTMLEMNLRQEGYEVHWLQEGKPALSDPCAAGCDLIILDIMLPDITGLDVLKQLREKEVSTPVLMLTAMSDVDTKVNSLDLGADDYLTKPFDLPELLARIRALIRRSQGERHLPSSGLLLIGTSEINLETRRATSQRGEVRLSAKEAELLGLFARNIGRPLSRTEILESVWGMDVWVTERTVDNFVLRLRKLFEPDPLQPAHFITIRGVGYQFETWSR
jgi:two-component system, OmpR family, alkaline phosphatase synthesis response regulator PhoP